MTATVISTQADLGPRKIVKKTYEQREEKKNRRKNLFGHKQNSSRKNKEVDKIKRQLFVPRIAFGKSLFLLKELKMAFNCLIIKTKFYY